LVLINLSQYVPWRNCDGNFAICVAQI
jgi:hypothetical protein